MEGVLGFLVLLVGAVVFFAIKANSSTDSPKRPRRHRSARTTERWQRGHVGTPGEHIHLSLTYVDRKRFENNGRPGYRYRFRDDEGHCLLWFTSLAKLDEAGKPIPPGSSVKIKATVASHKNYHGVHETVVERVKVERSGERSINTVTSTE
jgi:hypothetical protein